MADRELFLAKQPHQRLEGAAVAEPRQRAGDRHQQLAVALVEQPDQGRHRARVADVPERRHCRLLSVDVAAPELLDEHVHHRRAEAHDRLDQLVLDRRGAEHARQRAFDRRAAQPAEDHDEILERRS